MDYYYTIHEIVVAKFSLLLADEPFPAEFGGELETIAHCHRMIYFQ